MHIRHDDTRGLITLNILEVVKFGVGELHINAIDHEKPCSIFQILPKGSKKWWGRWRAWTRLIRLTTGTVSDPLQ